MNKIYKTAIYLRLSREDEGEKESGSIVNQRQLLMSFVNDRKDLQLIDEFVDDGYSGYDFERPAFKKMIKCAKNNEIDCIVVKDFSRLGRNFQKTEEYLQKIFPELGIRFIAVNNCYDNIREMSTTERLANPIINLLNEYHVMETSQKVRNVLEYYRRNGKFIGNHTVYGYVIKNKCLEVDPEAAEIVRRIFDMKIEGMSNQSIGDYLNEIGIKSPLEYKIKKGIAVTGKHFRDGEKALWSSVSVKRILENPIYIGTLVQGKTSSISYRDKRRFKKDVSELAVFENSHEAIISETAFLIVQDLLQKDSYSKAKKESYLFSGFAFCGNCGKILYHRQAYQNTVYWQCKNKECLNKGTIKEDILSKTVFETLKMHMKIVLNCTQPIVTPDFVSEQTLTDLELTELHNQIKQLQNSQQRLSEQRKDGVIFENDFNDMNSFYNQKIAKIESEIEIINKRKARISNCIEDIKSRYHKYFNMTELTRGIVVTFIEKIEVFNKNKIRIFFRYEDFFKTDGDISGT